MGRGKCGTVTGYRVYEGTTVRATVTGTSATITGLGRLHTHTYTVAAYNAAGESAAQRRGHRHHHRLHQPAACRSTR